MQVYVHINLHVTGNNTTARPNGKHGGSQIHSVLSFSKTSWQALRHTEPPIQWVSGFLQIWVGGNFTFVCLHLGGYFHHFILRRYSQPFVTTEVLQPTIVLARYLVFARCLEAPSDCEAMNCFLFSLHANPVLPTHGTRSSFQLLCVPLTIPLKLTVWRKAYIIHVTSDCVLRHRLVISHIKKHSTPLNSVVRSHILLHGILLRLTDTAVRDNILIHRYCGTRAYYDSTILWRRIILRFTGAAALGLIMTHRYCGAGSYYDSPILRH
jgi:hypothetical protein